MPNIDSEIQSAGGQTVGNVSARAAVEINFNRNLSENYEFRKQKLEIYLMASSQNNKCGYSKVAILLNCIEVLKIYNHLLLKIKDKDKDKDTGTSSKKFMNILYCRKMLRML